MEELIIRYLQDNATGEEKALLDSWLNENKNNQDEFEAIKKTWELTSRLIQIHSIDVVSARKKIKRNIPEFRKSRSLFFYWQKIAAVIFIPVILAATAYIYFFRQKIFDEIFQQEVMAAYGTRTQLSLPDGTEVWLNSGSKIKFPSKFLGNRRDAYLEGEAFFNVSNDKFRPFYVNLGEMSVKAVGTSFNITAYKKDNTYETTLISGKILLVKKSKSKPDVVLFKMEPNQHAIYDKSMKKIILYEDAVPPEMTLNEIEPLKSIDSEPISQKYVKFDNKYTSWIDGKLIFRNDPMDEVIKRLGRWYNVDIQLQDTLLYDFRYTATFIDETLVQVLDLLKLTAPIECTLTDRKINEDNSFSKKLVIIKLLKKK